MKIEIDAQPVSNNLVYYRPIGFGKPITNHKVLHYVLTEQTQVFTNLLAPDFDEYMAMEAEDQLKGLTSPPDIIEKYGCHPLAELIATHPEGVAEIIKRMFVPEMLAAMFDKNHKNEIRFVINDIKSIIITPQEVTITGTAWEIAGK